DRWSSFSISYCAQLTPIRNFFWINFGSGFIPANVRRRQLTPLVTLVTKEGTGRQRVREIPLARHSRSPGEHLDRRRVGTTGVS
ncbi:MAG: hypothetical protein V3R16_02105, partial [Nitrospirales bacterium]